MEFDLLSIFRGLAIAAFLSGLIWAGWALSKPFALSARPFRLGRMMQRLGIDRRRLREGSASRTCLTCPDKNACDAWLANDNPGFEPPIFCPNKGYLRRYLCESGLRENRTGR